MQAKRKKAIAFKRWLIEVPLYHQGVWLYYCSRAQFIDDVHKRLSIPHSELEGPLAYGQALHVTHPECSTEFMIFYNAEEPFGIDVVAHEAYHTTSHLLWCAGMEHTSHSEEAFSYLHGFLFKEIYDRLKKAGLKW